VHHSLPEILHVAFYIVYIVSGIDTIEQSLYWTAFLHLLINKLYSKSFLGSGNYIQLINMENFLLATKMKPSCSTNELTVFPASKEEWSRNEGTSKSMKNALYALRSTKSYLLGPNNIEQ